MNIIEFYRKHKVKKDFDEVLYMEQRPEAKNFYKPFCVRNNIDDKHRLYYHYVMYGGGASSIQGTQRSKDHDKIFFQELLSNTKSINDYKILIKIPTYKRPDKLVAAIESFINRANNINNILIMVSANLLDDDTLSIMKDIKKYNCVHVIFANHHDKIDAYNANIDGFNFDILILASDDMIVVQDKYDSIISILMDNYFSEADGCLWFDSGDGNRLTNTISVVGKKFYDKIKPIYNPAYQGYYCDDEFTQICIKLGRIVRINHCLIKHNVPKHINMHNDSTYLKSLQYSLVDKARYKIRKNVQFDIPGLIELPKNHNLPKETTKISRNHGWSKNWHKSEPWYDDPISVMDLYVLERKYEQVYNMDLPEFKKFAYNYYRNFRWTFPKIIHQIWLGDKNPDINEMMASFSIKYIERYPEWRYILWDENKLSDLVMQNQDIFNKEQSYDCKSDIARLEILHQFGGIYLDADFIWLEQKPLDELFKLSDRGILMFWEKSGQQIGTGLLDAGDTRCSNAFIGSTISNPIISFMIGRLRDSYNRNRNKGVVASTGPDFIQNIITNLGISIAEHSYAFPVWFCLDRLRNPDYDHLLKYRSESASKIRDRYPKAVLFHRGWGK